MIADSHAFYRSGAISTACLVLLVIACFASRADAEDLSGPLTLNKALSLADASHPQLKLVDAELAYAVSNRLQAEDSDDLDAYFEVAPYTSNPTTNDRFLNDSYIRLSVTKQLYDFGYTESLEKSADELVISKELIATDARNKYYLKIMQYYFDVLLADLHFAAIDEAMTTYYVQFDKLRERHSLGMVSDVALAAAENRYREFADLRKSGELEQQSSRLRLAILLNRPDDIPGDLIRPALPELDRQVPELESLTGSAMQKNLMLTALEHAMFADKAAMKATKQQYGPTLAAGLEMNEYERRLPGRNNASIGVTLHIPITSGQLQAESARAAAEFSASQAKYEQAKYDLRQQLSDLVNRLQLLHFKRASDQQRLSSTSLNVDQSRARYELEQQTTLGDSMARYTEAEWLSAKTDFDIAITWAQIDLLTGKNIYPQKEK